MPTVDEAVENITWAAGDSFLSDYLNEVLNEVLKGWKRITKNQVMSSKK